MTGWCCTILGFVLAHETRLRTNACDVCVGATMCVTWISQLVRVVIATTAQWLVRPVYHPHAYALARLETSTDVAP